MFIEQSNMKSDVLALLYMQYGEVAENEIICEEVMEKGLEEVSAK